MKKSVQLPENIEAEVSDGDVKIKGNGNEVKLKLNHPLINIELDDDIINIEPKIENKKTNSISQTFRTKIKNAVTGVTDGFEYRLKVVYKHFPMEVKVNGDRFVVSNFLGEKKDREASILENVSVKVDDENITVSGPDKEKVGQTAANIERNMQAPNTKDRRVFEDGIYIVKKPSVED